MTSGLHIERRFTADGRDPYDTVEWSRRDSRITNPDGSIVFEMKDAEVPAQWSQVAADIMVSKYFRKAGVPQVDSAGNPVLDDTGAPVTGPEQSARQVVKRLASTWRWWGETNDYFATGEDAQAFEDELAYMLLHQMAAPNSPQWFNTGLAHQYGITGTPQGFWYVDPATEEAVPSPDSYTRPAPHACFPAGTRITTRGGFLPIEKIEPGDEVLTHEGRYRKVQRTMQRQVDEELVELRIRKLSATPLVATANHPVWAIRKEEPTAAPSWIPASDLRPGDLVVVGSGDGQQATAPIVATTPAPFYGTVYNFQTDEDESYVASGVVVHNCFINSVDDDLVNEGGIMDLWVREARLFKMGSGCTSGDSRVYVAGQGFVPIRDLYAQFASEGRPVHEFDGRGRYIDIGDTDVFTLSVDDATGEYTQDKIELVWAYDVDADDKVTVAFDTGARATVSAWHPFLVWDGERVVERRADELGRGDSVIGPNQTAADSLATEPIILDYETTYYRRTQQHSVLVDTDVAWLVGYFMGDGSLGRVRSTTTNSYGKSYEYDRLRLRFHDETTDTLERVQRIVSRVFGETAAIQADGRGSRGQHVSYTGRKVTAFFASLFEPGTKTYTLAMPRFVWLAGREAALGFLAGLVDSDGAVANGRAAYTTASHRFADEVATLASVYGLGGGVVRHGSVSTTAVVRRSTSFDKRLEFAGYLSHPSRRTALLDEGVRHERSRCMPLSEGLATELFGEHAPADWLKVLVGEETFHLGRLRYEGIVNPTKLEKALATMEPGTLTAKLGRIAESLAFVTSVEACTDDPDFYDLTVARHSNYLAGEHGLVAIHNTGSNFSRIRAEGEQLSGGGKSSGLMSFLKVGDRAAGAIKSGGTTRRAAKMVILDVDHPDIETFINWKADEEDKVRALVAAGYSSDFNGEAYATVSGQNSNNSVRLSNEFIQAVLDDGEWDLTARTDGRVMKTVKARDLWKQVAEAAWKCADPGVQFDTTIQEWHTSPAGGKINATNPCSEYVFLDNTACNLASLNLVQFERADGSFDLDAYRHAIRIWTVVLEISVTMAHFPSKAIAEGSYDYRTLGLGYANLGSLLMRAGIAYDSDLGRSIAGALTAILTGYSYATSAEMAEAVGPFRRFAENRDSMLRVMRNHRRAAYGAAQDQYDAVSHYVVGIDQELCPPDILAEAHRAWDSAVELGEEHGYRNAQTTVLAPTGCLVGGSLIPTSRGLVRLRSLGDPAGAQWQDLGIQVGTDEGARTGTQFYVNGVEPVVTVDTHRGYRIQGTPTHRIKVVEADGSWVWKRFGDIAAGDKVPLQLDQLVGEPQQVELPPRPEAHWTSDFTTVVPRTMSPELAEFVGYFMGDGSLHAKGIRLCVSREDFDVVDRLSLLGKELFGLEAHVNEIGGYTEVAFHSVPLVLWWEACRFAKTPPSENHSGKGYHPHIPDAVLHSNDRAVYAGFLRGLFEADGTVHLGYPSWSTTSLEFSRDVQSLLLALGHVTTRKIDRTGWGDSDLAVLRLLNLSAAGRWADEIGFIGGRKQSAVAGGEHSQASRDDHIPVTRATVDRLAPENDNLRKTMLLALSRIGSVSRRSAEELLARTGDAELRHLLGFFYDEVTSAELGEEQYTFDLSVPDNVTYVANGFVSHNTIGLLMDCDTTGVEPDFALVKFKKLAGGGYFKIANQSIAPALERLGYTRDQVSQIIDYVVGTMTLNRSPRINTATLIAKGFTADDIDKVEAVLPGVFELGFAFNQWTLGEETMRRLGFTSEQYNAPGFTMLKALGFTDEDVRLANDHICGRQTIEGAPHLRDEHLPVFDTANRNGRLGERFIHHTGHIRMMAAAQPFISGAISKTINMPNEVTVEDIEESYHMSWELGLKAMALYRDGSKASQPLSAKTDDGDTTEDETDGLEDALAEERELVLTGRPTVHAGMFAPGVSPTAAYADMPRPRFLLPARRSGYTQEARVGGHKLFMRTGEYQDGTLGELFLDLAKEGATLRGILSCFAIAVSKGLQYGVPLEEYVDTFTFQTFEPRGMVEGHPNIKMANSIVDYVFRALGVEYLERDELAQVPPDRSMELPEPRKGLALDAGVQLDLTDAAIESDIDAQVAAAAFVDADDEGPGGDGVARALGLGSGAVAEPAAVVPGNGSTVSTARSATEVQTAAVQAVLADKMGDAPLCDTCGHITVRNGSCYRCLNCGDSKGCS